MKHFKTASIIAGSQGCILLACSAGRPTLVTASDIICLSAGGSVLQASLLPGITMSSGWAASSFCTAALSPMPVISRAIMSTFAMMSFNVSSSFAMRGWPDERCRASRTLTCRHDLRRATRGPRHSKCLRLLFRLPYTIQAGYINGPQVCLFWVHSRDTPDWIAAGSFMSRVQASHPAARRPA